MHASFDLETLSTKPRSVVLSIGVTLFSQDVPPSLEHTIVLKPTIQPQLAQGRLVDMSTLCFWSRQKDEVRAEVFTEDPSRIKITQALDALSSMLRSNKVSRVWGNGSVFDITILESLFSDFEQEHPWGHREIRDLRTLKELKPDMVLYQSARPHVAEEDSLAQAKTIAAALGWWV